MESMRYVLTRSDGCPWSMTIGLQNTKYKTLAVTLGAVLVDLLFAIGEDKKSPIEEEDVHDLISTLTDAVKLRATLHATAKATFDVKQEGAEKSIEETLKL